jgi:hypothetical protein
MWAPRQPRTSLGLPTEVVATLGTKSLPPAGAVGVTVPTTHISIRTGCEVAAKLAGSGFDI